MNRFCKTLTVAGLAAGGYAAVSFYREYRKMKKIEDTLESLPLHQLKKKLTTIRKEDDQIVFTVPNDMLFADKLRVCANILTAKSKGDVSDEG